jgi:hypothetical protein
MCPAQYPEAPPLDEALSLQFREYVKPSSMFNVESIANSSGSRFGEEGLIFSFAHASRQARFIPS